MTKRKMPILRVAGPTLLVSLVLFVVCTAAAIFLYRLHARSAESLTDDIDSRRAAANLENSLRRLLVGDGQHRRTQYLLEQTRELVSSEEEENLVARIEQSFDRYLAAWHDGKVKEAVQIIERETMPEAAKLRRFNSQQMDMSEEALRGTVKWFAWGLVLVGTVGSLGGILFGYGVARALRHSIYRLSVSIRHAANKLREELPTVTLTHGDGIDHLQSQMHALVHDIEQVVERLQQRDRELMRAEQMAAVGQLAAGVAHELRNPLTAVKMLVQSSREELAERGVHHEDLTIIEQEIRRVEKSLQGFLDLARPPRMEWRSGDLGEVIHEALALVAGRARQQSVTVDFAPPEPAVRLRADVEQLRQVFVNLAMNALDAMPHGGKLTVSVTRTSGGFVAVEVADTGPGIAEQVQPRLFQPFVTSKETGLGLGLVISRRIAESHGGTLTVEQGPVSKSANGEGLKRGACFTLRLPLSTVEPPEAIASLPETKESGHDVHAARR